MTPAAINVTSVPSRSSADWPISNGRPSSHTTGTGIRLNRRNTGPSSADGRANGRGRLDRIGRHDHRHVGDRARPREVFDGVMRRPKLAVRHAARNPAELHVVAAVREVGLDLLERAAGQKARGAAGERNLAGAGQTRADADHVLLGDADIDQPVRKPFAELLQVGRADRVVADDDDAAVLLGEREQRLGESDAAVVQAPS